MNKHYRIKDIADLSGVSTGTVDRILHNRGKVSEEARRKVEAVLKEIDYQPNLIARSLALKKNYCLLVVIPSFAEGEYWEKFQQGIGRAEQDLAGYHIEVVPLYFDQYDPSSFEPIIDRLETADCQGVAIATLFREPVLRLTAKLDERKIPYVLVDAYIEDTNCLAYYGTHSYSSGYLSGRLLVEQLGPDEEIAVFRIQRNSGWTSTQGENREKGFRDYMENKVKGRKIHTVSLLAGEQEANRRMLDAFFEAHPAVGSGVIFNSRAHVLGDYFSQCAQAKPFRLIGYDGIAANISYLKSGLVTYLIAQRPEVQGMNCIHALFRYLVMGIIPERVNYMPLDILVKENIDFYNNYL